MAEKLAKNHEVTIFLSGAAEEVLQMYDLYDRVAKLTSSKYVSRDPKVRSFSSG